MKRRGLVATALATLRIVPHAGEDEHTLLLARAAADSSKALPGCVAAEIYREIGPPRAILLAELWSDVSLLEAHIRSRDFDLILDLMEASAERPALSFHFIAETRHLAWVEALRATRPEPRDERRGEGARALRALPAAATGRHEALRRRRRKERSP